MDFQKQLELENSLVTDSITTFTEAFTKNKNLMEFPSGNKLLQNAFIPLKNEIMSFINNVKIRAIEKQSLLKLRNHKDKIAVTYLTYYTIATVLEHAWAEDKTLISYAHRIVDRVIDNLIYNQWTEENEGLANYYKDIAKSHESGKIQHLYAKAFKKANIKIVLSNEEKTRVGVLLLELLEKATGLIKIASKNTGAKRTERLYVILPEEVKNWVIEAHKNISKEFFYEYLPLLCEPKDWTNTTNGGYLTKRLKFIKTNYLDRYQVEDCKKIFAAANKLQKTAWRVNQNILKVFLEIKDCNLQLAGMVASEPESPPGKLWNDEKEYQYYKEQHPELVHEWKLKMRDYHLRVTSEDSKRRAILGLAFIAQKFQDDTFYFVYTADWRGRLYATGTYLNPQGDDWAKGLLEFGEGKKVTEEGLFWLKVHLANTYGYDKVSFEDRVKWVDNHFKEIKESTQDPLRVTFWDQADSPFCFLAACYDYVAYLADPENHLSHLPLAMDATCSGLQHLSALLRDGVGGKAVNLTSEYKRFDIYSEVKEVVVNKINQAIVQGEYLAVLWEDKIDRSMCKRAVMTTPLNPSGV